MEEYYHLNSEDYILETIDIDMSEAYSFVERYLKEKAKILDVGFGSGRDMLYFASKGHQVEGIDIEENFITHALELGLNAKYGDARNYKTRKRYDLIWACASLVHMKRQEMLECIRHLLTLLKKDGLLYLSLKCRDHYEEEVDIDGRFYTYVDLRLLSFKFKLVEKRITYLKYSDYDWLNALLRKE